MTGILIAVLTLGVLGLFFGIILAIGSKVFAVEQDERIPQVTECLPGANCGACGYAGCSNLAQAIVEGKAPINACVVGGNPVMEQIAEIMGAEKAEAVKMVAYIKCRGGNNASKKFNYEGLKDCTAALRVANGPLDCTFGCIGLGTCAATCPYGAITVENGVAVVNDDICVGCGKCASKCPRNLIEIISADQKYYVGCNSKAKGAEVRKICNAGCIGCMLCVKNCPHEAIAVVDNLAKIDYSKCQNCGKCAEVCPRKIIVIKE